MLHAGRPLPAAASRLASRVKDGSAVRRRRVGKGGGAGGGSGGAWVQGAWPGERVMEEAESEGEEVRGAGGAAGSAETMASGDGGRVEGDLQRALRRGS